MTITLESLLTRVRTQVKKHEAQSAKRKLEARLERMRRQPSAAPQSMYQREELWQAVALHREYEIQLCDTCKCEQTSFSRERIELRHKLDTSARRWRFDRGEAVRNLPLRISIVEHVVPECWHCYTIGRTLKTLFNSPESSK